MTERLYYQDAYMKEFSAIVTAVRCQNGRAEIQLDRTAFYPEGGGQGADSGVIETSGGIRLSVTDVQEEEGSIWHTVEICMPERSCAESTEETGSADDFLPALTETGVTGHIDWAKRFDHMQQHSGEHIVSGMICSRFSCDNVGFHMGEDITTIDYNVRISMEEALEIEKQANEYIWEDHPFIQMWPTTDELKKLDYRSKKEIEGNVRITSFPGADVCACCGVHVSGSAQVGLVKFISAKNFHEGTRLELLCGKRAADFLAASQNANKAVAVMLSTSEENTPAFVRKLMDENIALKAGMSEMEAQYFSLRARTFEGQDNVALIEDHLDPEQGRRLADAIADHISGAAVVFAKAGNAYGYSVISRSADAGEIAKRINISLNGKGGGRGGFARGSVQSGRKLIEEAIANGIF